MRASKKMRINLVGRWSGDFGPHGEEIVEIAPEGEELVATKITGDPNVPAGQVSFRVVMLWRHGTGQGQIAETGYRNPRWVPGQLEVLRDDLFVFTWAGCGSIYFCRVVG